jgi:hypothetical protein
VQVQCGSIGLHKQKCCEVGLLDFILSFQGIDFQKLLILHTKYVQCLAEHSVLKGSFAYGKKQNTREFKADGHAFVMDYEVDFSTRFKPEIHVLAANN